MADSSARERYIKWGKRLRQAALVVHKFATFGYRNNSRRDEIFIDTKFGKVRTLWYGFKNTERTPIYFDLHGGGFLLGSTDMDEEMNLELTKQVGCKICSIQYAKAPEFPYPVAVNQVYAVVKQVFENAEKYAIDRNKMAIGGHSAGGNLSTVTCMKAKKEGEFKFACQILDYPPLDLVMTNARNKPQPKGAISPTMAMIFDACYVDPSQDRDPYVSPVYATQEDLAGLPPALVIVAGKDSLHDEGLKYREMLMSAGVITECYDYTNSAHGFTYKRSPDTIDAWAKMAGFLKKYLYS